MSKPYRRAIPREVSERIRVRSEVMSNVDLSPHARLLYFLIDERAGEAGEVWWHWRKLALAISVGHTKFFSCVKELEKAGVITIRREGGRIYYKPQVFRQRGMNGNSRSASAESSFRERGISAGPVLITELGTEKGAPALDDLNPGEEPDCYRCKDTGRWILGDRRICACEAGKSLRRSA